MSFEDILKFEVLNSSVKLGVSVKKQGEYMSEWQTSEDREKMKYREASLAWEERKSERASQRENSHEHNSDGINR